MKSRGTLFLIFAVLLFSLAGGNILHEIIPHTHESEFVWVSLHGILWHGYKYALTLATSLAVVLLSLAGFFSPKPSLVLISSLEQALRRGILPHRRFG